MNAPHENLAQSALESYFHDLAACADRELRAGEQYLAWFAAESSDFVRFNGGKVRQPGVVTQRYLDLDLVVGERHASQHLSLCGRLATDAATIAAAFATLRAILPGLAPDPHLLYATEVHSTRSVRGTAPPDAPAIVDQVIGAAAGTDFVGIYAGGPVVRGFANGLGQRNWHETTSFDLQWSLYHRADKAVKTRMSGFEWDPQVFAQRQQAAREQLAIVAQPARRLDPGAYRAYLAPAAMEEIVSLLCWGGFSGRALATKQSALMRLAPDAADRARLSESVTMAEAIADGTAPAFQGEGFVRPPRVPLIERGTLAGSLVSPRTSREFGLNANGANGGESPESLAMEGGTLRESDILAALDTGLYVGNLWYLNYSDRTACRMTGMTRFATFRVERGKIVAPVDVLRFDDSLYRMLGTNLEALTANTELMLASDTYEERSLASARVPGALLAALAFTL